MFLRITNSPRDYAWGSTTAIAELLGTEPSGGPEAELWLGAHPGSPARIVDGAPEADLAAWAAAHAPGGRLPFLLKVLAASTPLSLQAHPTMDQAQEGFARENAAGVPIDASARNYKDAFHKPELLYALSDPFRALCGFRPVAEARADLASIGDERVAPLIDRLTDDGALPSVFEWLITRGPGVDAVVAALSEQAAVHGGEPGAWLGTVARLAEHYPGDAGIAISTLMHTVQLRPGEALYLPAGNIHAYLEGLGIELMAASDNVLRGGLTGKHLDVPELMRVLEARPLPAPYLEPEHPAEGVSVFRPEVPDFVLTVVEGSALAEAVEVRTEGLAIALCTDGGVRIDDEFELGRGEAALLDAPAVRIVGNGRVFIASGRRP